MPVRQVRLGKALQMVALEGIDAILRTAPPGDLKALAAAAREGVSIERLALGEATSRSEVRVSIYDAVVKPILVTFRDIVMPGLPDDERDHVVRQFADRVNDIRDLWEEDENTEQQRREPVRLLAAPREN